MKKLALVLGLAAGVAAQADVKPNGTILDAYCGSADKSTKVCLANVVGGDGKYLVLHTVGRPSVYLRVAKEAKASDASGPTTYVSYAQSRHEKTKYIVEKALALTTQTSADKKLKAAVSYDGKELVKDMVLEPVVHTQDAGSDLE